MMHCHGMHLKEEFFTLEIYMTCIIWIVQTTVLKHYFHVSAYTTSNHLAACLTQKSMQNFKPNPSFNSRGIDCFCSVSHDWGETVICGDIEKLGNVGHIWREKENQLSLWNKIKVIDKKEWWRVRWFKEAAHMLGNNILLSRPSIEFNSICELHWSTTNLLPAFFQLS